MPDGQAQPFFTVVIPTYNRADTVESTLQSVKRQSFADFECIVVDDGSADGGKLTDVVSGIGDSRFYYVRQSNGGACSARNRGFDLARGKYVALLDSDDLFLPHKLATMHDLLREREGDTLVYSQMIVERGLAKKWVRPTRGLQPAERVDEYLLCTDGTIRTSTVVVNTALAQRLRFDEALPSLQDTDFAIRVANAGADVTFLEEPLVVFEDRVGGVRVSRNSNYKPLLDWLDRLRDGVISERAYWAGRGWQCARIASYNNRPYAIRLYLESAVRGAFRFRQAMIVAAQVVLPYHAYQRIADMVVSWFGRADL